jgi:hypothetical protein
MSTPIFGRMYSHGLRKCRGEQIRVQEIAVGLTGLRAEAVEVWKLSRGDFIRHLEAEPEIVRHLIGEAFEIFATRKRVVRRIDAHGLEHLRILGQAHPLETRAGELAAIHIARVVVELAPPAFVFPGRRAEINALGRQFRHPLRQRLPVKCHAARYPALRTPRNLRTNCRRAPA